MKDYKPVGAVVHITMEHIVPHVATGKNVYEIAALVLVVLVYISLCVVANRAGTSSLRNDEKVDTEKSLPDGD